MKLRTLLVLSGLFVLLSNPVRAAEGEASLLANVPVRATGTSTELAVGVGTATFLNEAGMGVSVNIGQKAAGIPLFYGFEVGIDEWRGMKGADLLKTFPIPTTSRNLTAIRLLPTFRLEAFEWISGVVPYLGLALGPVVFLSEGNTFSAGANRQIHEGMVSAAVFVQPGVQFWFSPSWGASLEGKLGWVAKQAYFSPVLSVLGSL